MVFDFCDKDKEKQKMFWNIAMKNHCFTKFNGFIHPEAGVANAFFRSNPKWLE